METFQREGRGEAVGLSRTSRWLPSVDPEHPQEATAMPELMKTKEASLIQVAMRKVCLG